MRPTRLATIASIGLLGAGVQAFMPTFNGGNRAIPPKILGDDAQQALTRTGPAPALPLGSTSNDPTDAPIQIAKGPDKSGIMLSDIMGRDRSINIFAGFTREVESVSRRLDDSSQNSTVLAPVNSAIEALPRKPWEDPKDYERLGANVYNGDDGLERAQKNLEKFVQAHIIPLSPWVEGDKVDSMTGEGKIWWEEKDGVKRVHPGDIEVMSVTDPVGNGEVWILKGVQNYV